MSNIIRMPYAVAPRTWITKLVRLGYLGSEQRHDAEAVEDAVGALRRHSEKVFSMFRGGNEPAPPAA
jgi:hypothetical protein